MQYLEAACVLVVVPVCSLAGIIGSALTMRIVLHKSMRAHLINRCIFALSSIDFLFLTTALAHSALAVAAGGAFNNKDVTDGLDGDGDSPVVSVMRRLLLPALARASLLVIVIISAERFCAVRKPRHLQAGNSRKSLVYASLTVAAVPFAVYGLELAMLAPPTLAGVAARSTGNVTSPQVKAAVVGDASRAVVAFAAADASLRCLPLAGILLLNLGIIRVLRQSFRQRERLLSGFLGIQRALLMQPGRLPQNSVATVLQRQRKTTCMLVYMSTFHLVVLTPAIFLSVLARVRSYRPTAVQAVPPEAGPRDLAGLIVALETLSCSFNFALYIRQSEKFRTVFLGLFASGCARTQRR